MKKQVLSIGQCAMDNATLKQYVERNFAAKVTPVDLLPQALNALENNQYDLVLVNRKLDADYSDGIELIRTLKGGEKTKTVPVMLVSNLPQYQEEAVAAGAVRGFGKSEYNNPETKATLGQFLGAPLEGGQAGNVDARPPWLR